MEATTATLTLETLHIFSGELAESFDQYMVTAVADCKDRPGHHDKRVVTIKLVITPDEQDEDDVLIEPSVSVSLPCRKIVSTQARRTRNDQLQFDFIAAMEEDE